MEYKIVTPVKLKYLNRITLLQSSAFGSLKCEVVLRDKTGESSAIVIFEDLSEFEITKISSGRSVGPLKVLDISDRQWENLRYKVLDFEEEFLSFYCRAFSVKEQETGVADPN